MKQGFSSIFEKRRLERERQESLQRQFAEEEKRAFDIAFKQQIKKVAMIKAQRDAAQLSGIAKLRAVNKVENLNNPQPQLPALQKLRDLTERNIARREVNLERTKKLKEASDQMKQQKDMERQMKRGLPRKPFGGL